MGVLDLPFFELDTYPKTVDTEGDDGEPEPFDIVPEQLNTLAVEGEAFAVDLGVFCIPSVIHTVRPRRTDGERAYDDQEP